MAYPENVYRDASDPENGIHLRHKKFNYVLANDDTVELPRDLMGFYKTLVNRRSVCVRCHKNFLFVDNLMRRCNYHPLPLSEDRYMCCNVSENSVTPGCTSCDHSSSMEWNYGCKGPNPTIVAVPTAFFSNQNKPYLVLCQINGFKEELSTKVSYIAGYKPNGTPIHDTLSPLEIPLVREANDVMRHEDAETIYEQLIKEFNSYFIIERVAPLAQRSSQRLVVINSDSE